MAVHIVLHESRVKWRLRWLVCRRGDSEEEREERGEGNEGRSAGERREEVRGNEEREERGEGNEGRSAGERREEARGNEEREERGEGNEGGSAGERREEVRGNEKSTQLKKQPLFEPGGSAYRCWSSCRTQCNHPAQRGPKKGAAGSESTRVGQCSAIENGDSTRTRKCDRHLGGLVPGGEGLAAVAGRSVVEVLEPVRAVVHLARVSHGLQLQYLWIIPNAAVS